MIHVKLRHENQHLVCRPVVVLFWPHVILEAAVDVSSDVIVEKPTALLYELSPRLYAVRFYRDWWFLTVFSELRGLHARTSVHSVLAYSCVGGCEAQKNESKDTKVTFSHGIISLLVGPLSSCTLLVLLFSLETWNVKSGHAVQQRWKTGWENWGWKRLEGGNLGEGRYDLITASAKQCVIHQLLHDLMAAYHPKIWTFHNSW